jgi:hypothetical protein
MKWFPLVAVIASVTVAGCGSSQPVTRAHALSKLIAEINDGPSWESSQDAAAAAAQLGHTGGANGLCTRAMQGAARYVCYLQYRNPANATAPKAANGGGVIDLYFAEDLDGSHIRPITAVAYSGSGGAPAPTVTATTPAPPPKPPHIAGTECKGATVIAGHDTSCPFALAVARAALHGSRPGTQTVTAADGTVISYDETVSAFSPVTHRAYRMTCKPMTTVGPIRCTGGTGAVVTLGSTAAPTSGVKGCSGTLVRSAGGTRVCHGGRAGSTPIVWQCDPGDVDKAGVCVSATTGQPSPDRWYADPKEQPCTAPSTYETISSVNQRPVCMSLTQFARWKAAGEPS